MKQIRLCLDVTLTDRGQSASDQVAADEVLSALRRSDDEVVIFVKSFDRCTPHE